MLSLRVTWRVQNQRQEEFCVFSETHTFVPVGWSCKQQMGVSHSSTATDVIFLDADLRLDAVHAIGLCDIVMMFQNHKQLEILMRHFKEKLTHVKEQRCEAVNRGSGFCSPKCTLYQLTCVLVHFRG